MLSIERCKEILGERGTQLSDEQVLTLRDSLYGIINLIFDNMEKKDAKKIEQESCSSTMEEEISSHVVGA
jgi:hypothetical protein